MDDLGFLLGKVYRFADFEKRRHLPYNTDHYSLKNQTFLLKKLGNPHRAFHSIHVSGTKGKGTVVRLISRFISQRMRAHRDEWPCDFVVGAYYSPHIVSECERFEINGKICSPKDLVPVFEMVLDVIEKENIFPTVFDIFTASAFLLFARKKVDVAVVETGLGGRLDSTNVLIPQLSVITRIDYDHMAKLGNTLDKIAAEKAGIIKKGAPVVWLKSHQSVDDVVIQRARELSVPCFGVQPQESASFFPLWMGENVALASEAVARYFSLFSDDFHSFLAPKKIMADDFWAEKKPKKDLFSPLSHQEITRVCGAFCGAGRYEVRDRLLFDGAHIPRSLRLLVQSIKKDVRLENFCQKGVVFCFFALFDKDIEGMVAEIPNDWDFVLVQLDLPFVKQEILEQTYERILSARQKNGGEWRVAKGVSILLQDYHRDLRLYVFTGSFRLLGAVQKFL